MKFISKVKVAAVSVLFAAAALIGEEPEQRVVKVISSLHRYDLNPWTAAYTSEAQLFTGIYEGLFSYDPVTLEPVPALCANFKTSRDKRKWTFTVRENAKFSDGSLITAESIKNSWIGLLSTKDAPFASLLDTVSGAANFRTGKGGADKVRIEARDEKTLVVYLDEPMGHLPKVLCHHAFSAVPEKKGVFSGAFVLESYDGTTAVLAKNENYWDAENVKIPGVEIFHSDDYPENAFAFNDGNADWVMGNAEAAKILNKNSIHVAAEFGTVYLFFKNANFPWNTAEFRNALLDAVPYEKLRGKYSVQAETLVYPLSGYPKVLGIGDTDIEDAKYKMNQAREKYNVPADEKIPLVFAITGDEYIKEWASLLEEAWKPLGVELVTQATPVERYNASISSWNADLFYYSWIGDFADPLAFLELFRGGSSLNVADYKDDEFDSLLLESSRCDSVSDMYKLMAKAEQILLDSGTIIPVSHPISMHVINLSEIGGWQTNALDIHPFKYLYIKEPEKITIPNLVSF